MWKSTSVRKILASQADARCHGHDGGHAGQDEDGVVFYRADALVSRDVWERVQARLAANPVSARVNSWTLTQIAFCAACEGPMYGSTARYGDKTYAYYCCVHSLRRDGKCTARRVKADEMEAGISDELLAHAGDVEVTEDKVIPGREFSEDINRTVEQMTRSLQVRSSSRHSPGRTSRASRGRYSAPRWNWPGSMPSRPWTRASSP